MARPATVFAVVCLVVIGTGVAGGTATLTSEPEAVSAVDTVNRTNTSNVLRLPSINRSAVTDPDFDLSTALSIQSVRTNWRLEAYTVTERFDATNTTAGQETVLLDAVTRAEQAVTELRAAQRSVVEAYHNRSIDADTLLTSLATLQTTADAISRYITRLTQLNQGDDSPALDSVQTRLLRVEAELPILDSPLRNLIADIVTGAESPHTLFIGVGGDGITLSTVERDSFIHHTVRFDNFADQPGTSNASEALDRWAMVYPEVWDDGAVDFTGLSGAYRAALPFPGGDLVSYLDATTLGVYSETQSKTVDDLPLGPPTTSVRDELIVTVNRTYPGGPLRVAFLSDAGTPLDGVVRVNGRRVGTTGDDGVLWTIGPADQFAITVDYGDRQVALVVTPT